MRCIVLSAILTIFGVSLAFADPVEVPNLESLCGHKFESPEILEQEMKTRKLPIATDIEQYIAYADKENLTVWTFTKPGNPAHPSVVCRQVVAADNKTVVKTNVHCVASKKVCDAMVWDFHKLDEQMISNFHKSEEMKKKEPQK